MYECHTSHKGYRRIYWSSTGERSVVNIVSEFNQISDNSIIILYTSDNPLTWLLYRSAY